MHTGQDSLLKMFDKAVPILLRHVNGQWQILVFDHPLAGRQLIKGTIEDGESAEVAAVRELFEESGLDGVSRTIFMGIQDYSKIEQRWHFFRCELEQGPPEDWEHFTNDDGGHLFKFSWQPLDQPINNPEGAVFDHARRFVEERFNP